MKQFIAMYLILLGVGVAAMLGSFLVSAAMLHRLEGATLGDILRMEYQTAPLAPRPATDRLAPRTADSLSLRVLSLPGAGPGRTSRLLILLEPPGPTPQPAPPAPDSPWIRPAGSEIARGARLYLAP